MNTVISFSPIADKSARILLLGSMPGVVSLQANQYYAHPRNAFWRIMASIYGFNAESPYESRVKHLQVSGLAVWDVLHTCIRTGSLDSSIEKGSRVSNDFQSFFKQYPNIKLVAFNGAESEKSFTNFVLPHLNAKDMRFVRLPSSSPAHAVPLEKKIASWRLALGRE